MIWLLGILLAISIGLNALLIIALLGAINEVEDLEDDNKRAYKRLRETDDMIYEHYEIFDSLENDPLCLNKALTAYEDVCEKLDEDEDYDDYVVSKVCESITLLYDSNSKNYHSTGTGEITVSLYQSCDSEQDEFLLEYLNETYGTNLEYDVRTMTIFTILHEAGHCVDFSNKRKDGASEFDSYCKEYTEQVESLNSLEDEIESWRAYRQIPAEAFADKFAVDFMLKHFPELC